VNAETTAFIQEHRNLSPAELALLLSKKPHLNKDYIISQVNGLQKVKQKFPFLEDLGSFRFPSPRAFAQASSQLAAAYKASLIEGSSLIDLNGGMGMDSYFFSKRFEQVHYNELDTELYQNTSYNFEQLGSKNISCSNSRAEELIQEKDLKADWIYIDPDRRVQQSGAFKIEDCEPNVLNLLPKIWEKTERCMIKLSPMLDISLALEQLPATRQVVIVSIDNDCKELLFLLEKGFSDRAQWHCVNLHKNNIQELTFYREEEENSLPAYSSPLRYLYEPNTSLMKAGAFKLICQRYNGLMKLAGNTHLYTSDKLIEDFPGRQLAIVKAVSPQKGVVEQANIVSRNFPLSPQQIKKKYRIKDGGDDFLYAVSLQDKRKLFLLCERV
jgi:hypothetical protein